MLKSKQNEFAAIRDLYDRVVANKSVFNQEVSNLNEILDAAEEIKKRCDDMFNQIYDRVAHLHDILNAYEQYRRSYQKETKWIVLLKKQIDDYQRQQLIYKQQKRHLKQKYQADLPHTHMSSPEEDLNELKSSFDPIAVNVTFSHTDYSLSLIGSFYSTFFY